MRRVRAIKDVVAVIAAGILLWWRVPPYEALREGAGGFFDRAAVERSDGQHRSVLFVPPHQRGDNLPLIVFLHGFVGNGIDGRGQLKIGLGPAVWDRYRLGQPMKALALFPQSQYGWKSEASWHALLAEINAVCAEYNVDPGRVCLAGLMDGGAATWRLARRYPGRWSALATFFCGSPPNPEPWAGAHIWIGVTGGRADIEARDLMEQFTLSGADATVTAYDSAISDWSIFAFSDPRFWRWLDGELQISRATIGSADKRQAVVDRSGVRVNAMNAGCK